MWSVQHRQLPWIVMAAVFAAAPLAAANEPPADEPLITLEGLTRAVLERSPAVQAKRHAYEAARHRVIAAWLPDDPMFGADVEGQSSLFAFGDRTDIEYMASQTIPFPLKLITQGRIAAREAQMAYQRYHEEERDVIWHAEQPYYELYLAQKTLAALDDVRTLLQKLSRAVQSRYETNQASQQDLLKANVEAAKVDIERSALLRDQHAAEAHLSHLLNQSLDTQYRLGPEEPARPLAVNLRELEYLALHARPELLALDIGIGRAKASRFLTATRWLPDVTARWEGRQFPGESGIREHDTFVGVTVPVWSLVKGVSGEWAGAQDEVREAEAEYDAMKNEVLLAVHEAYGQAQAAAQALETYERTILPQAKQQVEVAFASYEAGRTDFLDLLDAQRTLKESQIAYYRRRADHERALADLRRAVGAEIPGGDAQ